MFETRAPGAKFTQIGDGVDGEIVGVRRTQQTEFKTNIPLYWENKTKSTHGVNPATGRPNDPMLQTEITVDTGVPDENGVTERRLFVRGKRMTDSLKHAVQQGGGGGDGLLIGGRLACTFYGTEPSAGGGSDAKLYRFAYAPPAAGEGRRPDPTPVLYDGDVADDPVPATFGSPVQRPIEAPITGAGPGGGTSVNASPVTTGRPTTTWSAEPPF
jgi:hypothetical protein